MRQLRHFGIRSDLTSKELSVTSRLLDKDILKHNIAVRKPLLQKGEYFHTKKLDKMHIAGERDGFTRTRCGFPCLGNNYADTKSQWVPTIRAEFAEEFDNPRYKGEKIFYKGGTERERCPECFGIRIYGDTPLYPSTNIDVMSNRPIKTAYERERLNQAVADRRSAKEVFKKTNVVTPIDKGDRYDDDYVGELVTNSLGLNRRIRR